MTMNKKPVEQVSRSAEQIEQERLTRRQVMRKFGFGAGLSAFMLLGVDDLARVVGQRMQQMDGDSRVAEQVAREFQQAGVALATPPGGGLPGGCAASTPVASRGPCCTWQNVSTWCAGYGNDPQCEQCVNGVYGSGGFCAGYGGGGNQGTAIGDCKAIASNA